MKLTFVAFALAAIVGLACGQLILDEDNAHDRKIIDMVVEKINEAEHKQYKFKNIVYTLGNGPKFSLFLDVTDTDGKTVACTVDLTRNSADSYTTGTVHCNIQ